MLSALVASSGLVSLPVSELVGPASPPRPLLRLEESEALRGRLVLPPVLTSHLIAVTWTTSGGLGW